MCMTAPFRRQQGSLLEVSNLYYSHLEFHLGRAPSPEKILAIYHAWKVSQFLSSVQDKKVYLVRN